MASIVGFPDPVNEVSARVVAAGVVVLSLATIVLDQPWLTAVIAYGFVARVLTGPRLSPLGQLATRVVTPRLGVRARFVPGPPKRFAQGIGAIVSVTAAVLALGFGLPGAAYVVLGVLAVAAGLEAVVGLCVGCQIFALLMRSGVVPQEVCERCRDLGFCSRTPVGHLQRGTATRACEADGQLASGPTRRSAKLGAAQRVGRSAACRGAGGSGRRRSVPAPARSKLRHLRLRQASTPSSSSMLNGSPRRSSSRWVWSIRRARSGCWLNPAAEPHLAFQFGDPMRSLGYPGGVRFGSCNVDHNPRTAGLLGIMSIPTLVVFNPSGSEA